MVKKLLLLDDLPTAVMVNLFSGDSVLCRNSHTQSQL